ncbi:hypothetical protein Tco_1331973 [Tanacetum coccineum]
MTFLTTAITSRFPTTNNQLRTSSNLRNQATIQDGRVIVQQVQGRQGHSFVGMGSKSNATSSVINRNGGNNATVQARVLAFLAEPGVAESQDTQKIITHNAAFQTDELDAFDSDCDETPGAKAVLMLIYPVMTQIKQKKKEDKYIKEVIDLEKQKKELENIIYKVGQSAQTIHMLTKPQVFYDDTHKQALGYPNPFYLKKAQRIKPTLYDGIVISKKHDVIYVVDSEETLILAEESR